MLDGRVLSATERAATAAVSTAAATTTVAAAGATATTARAATAASGTVATVATTPPPRRRGPAEAVDTGAQRIGLACAACYRFSAQVRDRIGLRRAVAVAVMARLALFVRQMLVVMVMDRCMVRCTGRTLRPACGTLAATALATLALTLAAAIGAAAGGGTLAASTAATLATAIAATASAFALAGLVLADALHHFLARCLGCGLHHVTARRTTGAAPDGLAAHGDGLCALAFFGPSRRWS